MYHINKTKDENYIIISKDIEKAFFDKMHHHFMVKTLNKLGINDMYFNMVKAVYDENTAVITLSGEKLEIFPPRSGTRQGCHSSHKKFWAEKLEKEKKNWIRKGKVKLSLFADDVIAHIENPEDSPR